MKEKQKNILYFTRTMNLGGTEKVILQLCETLKSEVNKIVVCSCGGVNTENLKKLGIMHYTIPDIENKSLITILSVIFKVGKIINKEKITIVHTHHRMAAFYTYILSKIYKVIFINTSHNTFSDKKGLTRLAYKHANLIACGEMVKKNLTDYFGLQANKITVIHNVVAPFDENILTIDIFEKFKAEGYTLVANVGRLSEQKGMEYFLRSIPKIREKHYFTKFIIVGDGEDKEKLFSLTSELCIEEDVIFLGYRSDIQNVISQVDLLVLSSLWEGLPLTPIEAFSVGKPVIATAVDGTVEVIDDGVDGILVEPRNSSAIAEGVNKLLDDSNLLNKYSINAKKKYESEFNYEQFCARYKDYYNKLLRQ